MDKKDIEYEKDKKYTSIVDEMKRHVRAKHKIRTKAIEQEKAFRIFEMAFRNTFNVPKKDLSKIGTHMSIQKFSYEIREYEFPKRLKIATKYKEEEYDMKFTVKKSILFKRYFIKYEDHTKASKTVFGLSGNLAKWWYKKKVKQNKKILQKEVRQIENKGV